MKNSNRRIQRHIDIELAKIFDRIKIQRLKLDKDKKLQSDQRISLAMSRHPQMKLIEMDIITAELK